MVNKVNPEGWLAWVLKRIEDHPANRINDHMPWAFQDMINAQNAKAEAKDATRSTAALMLTANQSRPRKSVSWGRNRTRPISNGIA